MRLAGTPETSSEPHLYLEGNPAIGGRQRLRHYQARRLTEQRRTQVPDRRIEVLVIEHVARIQVETHRVCLQRSVGLTQDREALVEAKIHAELGGAGAQIDRN